MPEISFCLFDLKLLAKVFLVKQHVEDKIDKFEELMDLEMENNRQKLFS